MIKALIYSLEQNVDPCKVCFCSASYVFLISFINLSSMSWWFPLRSQYVESIGTTVVLAGHSTPCLFLARLLFRSRSLQSVFVEPYHPASRSDHSNSEWRRRTSRWRKIWNISNNCNSRARRPTSYFGRAKRSCNRGSEILFIVRTSQVYSLLTFLIFHFFPAQSKLYRSTWLRGPDVFSSSETSSEIPNILHVVRYGADPMTFMVRSKYLKRKAFTPHFPVSGGSLYKGFPGPAETREVLLALKYCWSHSIRGTLDKTLQRWVGW